MKKLTIFLTAILITFGAVSCKNKTDAQNDKLSSPTNISSAEKLSGVVYKTEQLTLPTDMQNGYFMAPYDGGSKYFVLGSINWDVAFWKANGDLTDFDKVDFPDFDCGRNYSIALAGDGTIVTFVNHVDYGDLPEPDYTSEDYDAEAYESAAEYSYIINTYSTDGKLLSSVAVDEKYPNAPSEMSQIVTLCTDGKFLVVELEGTYELFDIEGKYYGDLRADDIMVEGIGTDSSGNIICAVESDKDQIMLCSPDENGKLTESDTAYNLSETIQGAMTPGSGDYSLFIRTSSAIYGINKDNSEIEMLFDLRSAGVGTHDLSGFSRGDDGNFILLICDYMNPTTLTKFIPKTQEEIENTPVLTIGYCAGEGQDSYFISDHIKPWNDDYSHDFRVELKFYEHDYENDNVFDEIAKDTLAGELPDVLFLDNRGYFGNVNMLEKGGLCDLYEFMDNDEVYNRDYFIPNVLKCFEHDGKLTSLTDRFYIDMGKCAKKKFIGEASDLSIDKMVQIMIDPPINYEPEDSDSKLWRAEGANVCYLSWQDWSDQNAGTCDYNSDSFIRFLKYCDEAPVTEFDFSNYNYNAETEGMTEKEKQEYQRERSRKYYRSFIDDTDLFNQICLGSYHNYVDFFRGCFGGEELSFTDEPEIDPNYYMAINADSSNKEMAWEFIKSYFAYERYENANYKDDRGYKGTGGFPVTKDGLKYDEGFSRIDYTDYSTLDMTKNDPKWKDYEGYVYLVDFEDYSYNIKLGKLTDEDIAAVNEIIDRAVPETYIDLTDDKFYEIAREEMKRYFNGGCTAEQCADAMQSRLSIYLSERYSS